MCALPLTPSDHPDYQKKHPIRPDDEFIVGFECRHEDAHKTLKGIFNKHGKGRITSVLTGRFWVKDISWDIVNELRQNPNVLYCGPSAGKRRMI